MTALREGLLEGRSVALAGGVSEAVRAALVGLGARVEALDGAPDALVYDACEAFGAGGLGGLTAALERAWEAVREVAAEGMIAAERPGKVVLVGPRPDAGPFAGAARAGLENLARTLSVEWARYGVTAVAVWPGERTTGEELAELVSFLVSPAGDYLSGCRLALGVV